VVNVQQLSTGLNVLEGRDGNNLLQTVVVADKVGEYALENVVAVLEIGEGGSDFHLDVVEGLFPARVERSYQAQRLLFESQNGGSRKRFKY
jgi:hypothetical protein